MSLRAIFLIVSSRFSPLCRATFISDRDRGKRLREGCGQSAAVSEVVRHRPPANHWPGLASPASVFPRAAIFNTVTLCCSTFCVDFKCFCAASWLTVKDMRDQSLLHPLVPGNDPETSGNGRKL
ncbi:hypothetical protein Pcinc_004046 [Petrolisthes cinctipes]|uniref:Secreted protein n=1 Tax=Petrolisthes cinctipes TaxID=88211 RepID=A0AAE1GF73_PETCI|nr:hypothetical protein Pcinc_004046 [Petrolisthes cinctipes]